LYCYDSAIARKLAGCPEITVTPPTPIDAADLNIADLSDKNYVISYNF